jgi:hypothetical protein
MSSNNKHASTHTDHNSVILQLQVEYDDGDAEELLVGLGVPIKVCIAEGQQLQLPLPSCGQLTQLSQVLLQLADQADADAAKPGGPAKRRQHQKEGTRCLWWAVCESEDRLRVRGTAAAGPKQRTAQAKSSTPFCCIRLHLCMCATS